tara:strand:- start:220 stop:399 length:180 start_codon:yes stop_codon:yes gene_type:complete
MGTPKYRRLNIRLRLKEDNTIDIEQFSEYNSSISVTNDGNDKIIKINADIEEMRHHGEL